MPPSSPNSSSSGPFLGYLLITTPQPNVFLGGLMVTDDRGLPVEFRYTEPVQPSRLQQILYGQALSGYLKREVILQTLLDSLESPLVGLFVEDDSLLVASSAQLPLARLSETQVPPLGSVGSSQSLPGAEWLLQCSQHGSPVRLQVFAEPPPLKAEGDNTPLLPAQPPTALMDVLTQAGLRMEVTEPLGRLQKALETLWQEQKETVKAG